MYFKLRENLLKMSLKAGENVKCCENLHPQCILCGVDKCTKVQIRLQILQHFSFFVHFKLAKLYTVESTSIKSCSIFLNSTDLNFVAERNSISSVQLVVFMV